MATTLEGLKLKPLRVPTIISLNAMNATEFEACKSCGTILISDLNWYLSSKKHNERRCINCTIIKSREYYEANKEGISNQGKLKWKTDKDFVKKHQERTKVYRDTNRDAIRADGMQYRKTTHQRIVEFLGGKCVVCGETDWQILMPNHKNGGGKKERRALYNSTQSFYLDILSGNRRHDDLDLRCANHNVLYEFEVGRHTKLVPARVTAIKMLGGACLDCGEADLRILRINYKLKGGVKERETKGKHNIYLEIVTNPSYRDKYDVRCANHQILYKRALMGRKD